MNNLSVAVTSVSKSFRVLKYHKTVLRALTALPQRESLRREHHVLSDVSFQIKNGEKVALIGRNGSGKTTLLRIVAGIYKADAGVIEVAEPPAVLFDASVGTVGILSVMDNIFLFGAIHEIGRDVLRSKAEYILDLAGLFELRHTPFQDLSKGQRQRFALSVFLQTRRNLIMFDEALTNLDIGFMNHCERHFEDLKKSNKTMIITSHDPGFLRRYCQRAMRLDEGRIRRDDDADEVISAYESSF